MKRSINLIPPATQQRVVTRRVIRVCSQAMVLSGLTAVALLGLEWARGISAVQELVALNARYSPLGELRKDQQRIAEKIESLRAREQLTLRLSRDEHGVALLAAIALAASESDGGVYVQNLRFDAQAKGTGERTVRLTGAGIDSGAVAEFAERLRLSGVFDTVGVESTGPLAGGVNLRRFDLVCQL